ncbi:MAG: alpha-mannosidase [Ruminococcaceae bacterium]|nr:alpha-mannosidase [Oscillospiraceae bacterium]
MKYIEKLNALNERRHESKWAERIASQLTYLDAISKHQDSKYNDRIEAAADFVLGAATEDGVITKATCLAAEEMLSDLGPVAKSFKELFVGHAHIDMNWMWAYNETAGLTVDTFRTVLDIMKECPDFTFGQSQASTYEIIEKFAPDMLPELKQRIKEGRWIVTAAEWVEPDKNMPDGESQTRQILQAKKYLSKLLDITPESLDFDFVPDTFGHNLNVPTVLANAGVKYMYHWRCCEQNPRIYYYVAPSGKKVLTYREFVCYLGNVAPEKFEMVPEFCAQTGLDTYLCVYGVGDHGGGPTRRDIERIIEYKSWPLTPTIEFGTYDQFFKIIENSGLEIPEIHDELNFIFPGCYTSQSRIKMANRVGEARINEAEQLSATASLLAGAPRNPDHLDTAWRNILFNHFHDILPGSGILETREHALGKFQDTLAYTNVLASQSMRKIAAAIDTTSIPFVEQEGSRAEGAGVGYNQSYKMGWGFPVCERGNGPVRGIHVFNTTGYDREEYAQIMVWNYEQDKGKVAFYDVDGNKLDFCIEKLAYGWEGFWGHSYGIYRVKVKVPALGYTTIVMKPDYADDEHLNINHGLYTRANETPNYDCPKVLENEYLKVTFDYKTAEIIEMIDKETGETLIDKPSGYLRLLLENGNMGMAAWKMGNITKEINLHRDAQVRVMNVCGGINAHIEFHIKYENTHIEVKAFLRPGSRVLEYDLHSYWRIEAPDNREVIPQLNFAVPVSYKRTGNCYYDMPYATLVRKELPHDVPALSYLGIESEGKTSIGLVTDTKYAFRCYDGEGSIDLLRATFDPDPCAEHGDIYIKFGIMAAPVTEMKKMATIFNHVLPISFATLHEGTLPLEAKAAEVTGGKVVVSCMKVSENGRGTAIRVYDDAGVDQEITIKLNADVKAAYLTDSLENVIAPLALENGAVKVTLPAHDHVTVVME